MLYSRPSRPHSIGNDGNKFYLHTNIEAPQYKVITVDVEAFRLASVSGKVHIKDFSKDLIPENKEAQLDDVLILGRDRLVTTYKRNVKDELYIHDLSGRQLRRLAPDHVGTFTAYGRRKQPFFFVSLTGFDTPGDVARFDFSEPSGGKADGTWKVWRETKVAGLAGGGGFLADQVWYQSKDGTKIPMFVVRHKDTPLDGTAPAIQYGECVNSDLSRDGPHQLGRLRRVFHFNWAILQCVHPNGNARIRLCACCTKHPRWRRVR
jgi:prolyl oligopeptidase